MHIYTLNVLGQVKSFFSALLFYGTLLIVLMYRLMPQNANIILMLFGKLHFAKTKKKYLWLVSSCVGIPDFDCRTFNHSNK